MAKPSEKRGRFGIQTWLECDPNYLIRIWMKIWKYEIAWRYCEKHAIQLNNQNRQFQIHVTKSLLARKGSERKSLNKWVNELKIDRLFWMSFFFRTFLACSNGVLAMEDMGYSFLVIYKPISNGLTVRQIHCFVLSLNCFFYLTINMS